MSSQSQHPHIQKIRGLELLATLLKNRIAVAGSVFSVMVITLLIVFFLVDNIYESTANLFPNRKTEVGLSLLDENGGLQSIASNFLGARDEESNKFIVLLSSYSVMKQVVDRFDLIEVYEVSETTFPLEDALDILDDRTDFLAHEEGNFTIHVRDKDPVRAKEMADYFVQLLNEINTRIETRDAAKFREFIEQRYEQSERDLMDLRDDYRALQKQYGVFELEGQVLQYLDLLGELSVKELEARLQMDYLKETIGEESQVYQQAEVQHRLVEAELAAAYTDDNPENFILNFNQLSDVGLQYFELQKRIEIETQIQTFVIPLLEQAKLDEVKNLPVVSVIDAPFAPEDKVFPRRSLIILLAGFSAFILIVLYMWVRLLFVKNHEVIQTLWNLEDYADRSTSSGLGNRKGTE